VAEENQQADMESAAATAVVRAAPLIDVDHGMAAELTKAEIDRQIATAHTYPRSMAKAIRAVIELATVDQPTAMECVYSLPRDNKLIVGPSVRLAELLFQQWGNNRVDTMIFKVDRKEGWIEAQAAYHDLETNSANRSKVRRRIKGKNGHIYSDDMIIVTGNAAAAIAKRNAILAGIPKPIWRQAYQKCLAIIQGDETTLGERRRAMLKDLTDLGLTLSQIYQLLGVGGEKDIGLVHMIELAGLRSGLTNGELTVDDLLGQTSQARTLDQAFGDTEKPKEEPPAPPAPPAPASEPKPAAPEQASTAVASEPKPSPESEVKEPEPEKEPQEHIKKTPQPFMAFSSQIGEAKSWADVRTAMMTVRGTASWAEADDDTRNSMDQHAYEATKDMADSGVTPDTDPQFFSLWLVHGADVAEVRPMFQRLLRNPAYNALSEMHRTRLGAQVAKKEGGLI
jgi:hypothetical protein